jgi:hypothetical protein
MPSQLSSRSMRSGEELQSISCSSSSGAGTDNNLSSQAMRFEEVKLGDISGEPGLTAWSAGLTASGGLTVSSGGLTASA